MTVLVMYYMDCLMELSLCLEVLSDVFGCQRCSDPSLERLIYVRACDGVARIYGKIRRYNVEARVMSAGN